ncbi:MAG: trypsin-like peptidase domain-containing protein [Lacisediminihabitans sp.]
MIAEGDVREMLRKKSNLKRRRIAVVSGVAVATVAIGSAFGLIAMTGGVSAASTSVDANTAAIQHALKLAQENSGYGHARYGYGYRSGGSGSGYGSGGYDFNSGGSSSPTIGTSSTPATTATAAQQVGIVDVASQLTYDSAEGEGTGMVLTSNGEILTNNHVVEGSTSVSVTVVATGVSYTASVVGTDATDDIAVLQLSGASGLRTANIGGSSHVSVGDAVTGVGNAGGVGGAPSAVTGTVTALDQSITTQAEGPAASETLHGLIESDANIQAGDSGGPLYNANGKIVGIDTAAQSGGNSVAGYSIPISSALSIARQIEGGHATSTITIGLPGFLGVEVSSAADSSASGFGADGAAAQGSAVQGAAVQGVISGTAAATAGLEAGDTITAVNGTAITSSSELTTALSGHTPGQRVTLSWVDASGASTTATVTLGTGPAA